MAPAKNAEFYAALRLLAGARFNLDSPCDCTEIIRTPPDFGQIMTAYENAEIACDMLFAHMTRYHAKEMKQYKTKRVN